MRTLKRFRLAAAALLAGAFTVGGSNALAQGGRQQCFERSYEGRHLRDHPVQKVRRIVVRLHGSRGGAERADVAVVLRNEDRVWRATTECTAQAGGLRCGVECDGGGVALRLGGSSHSLQVNLAAYGYIRLGESCDSEEAMELSAEPDDKLFVLSRAPIETCLTVLPE